MTAIRDHVAIATDGLDPRSADLDRSARRLRGGASVHRLHVDLLTETTCVRFDPHHCSSAVLTRTMYPVGFREARVA